MSKPMLFIDLDSVNTDDERLLAGRFVFNHCEPITSESNQIIWASDRVFYYREKEFNEQFLKAKELCVTGVFAWGSGSMLNFVLGILKGFDEIRANIELFNKNAKEGERVAYTKAGMFHAPKPTIITNKDLKIFQSLNMNVIPTFSAEVY